MFTSGKIWAQHTLSNKIDKPNYADKHLDRKEQFLRVHFAYWSNILKVLSYMQAWLFSNFFFAASNCSIFVSL